MSVILRLLTGGAISIGYALLVGLLLFGGQALHAPRFASTDLRPSDGVVVLTGGENRVREGLKLMTEAPVRRVLISGVYRSTSREDFRRHFALPSVLSDCCLDIGYLAQDTVGNAEETRAWVEAWGFQRLIVVTSGYHMPRSLLELRRALPDVELIPHPVGWGRENKPRWWLDDTALRLVLREYGKYIVALVRI
jgi:uncharacterized SAM-binding protein YcdF (DUF218 family)